MKGKYRNYLKHVLLPVIVYGALTGIVVGSVIFFFKLGAEWIMSASQSIYSAVVANPVWIPAILVGMALLGVAMYFLHRASPESKGAGIPTAEGVIKGMLTFRWLRNLVGTIIGSFISFFAGLPLGPEGPSVAIGTSIGRGTSSLPISHDSWDRYIVTAGACAGLTVASNAPLTGIVFALEEAHKRFSPMILLMAFCAVVCANTTATLWGMATGNPLGSLFHVGTMQPLAIKDIWTVALLGIASGLVACLFNFLCSRLGFLFNHKWKKKLHPLVKMVSIFVLVGIVGILLFEFTHGQVLGSGHHLVTEIANMDFSIQVVLVLLVVKLLLVALSTSSGATGGIFIPLLAIGALIGGAMGKLFIVMGMDSGLYTTIVMIGMVSFMGSSTRAPLTAMIFILESTWQFNNLLYVAVAVFVAFFIPEILRVEPIYDVLLEELVEEQNHGKTSKIYKLRYVVQEGCFAADKYIKDILFPAYTIVREVQKCDHEKCVDADGEKRITVGDSLLLQVQSYDLDAIKKELKDIFGEQPE